MPRRLASLASALLVAMLMLVLLALATRQAGAATAPAPAQNRTYPGASPCNTTLQACIDNTTAPGTIAIQPGTYVTSVTLSKALSLTGVSSATTILRALPNQRVRTVTGASIGSANIISGLTFAGGNVLGTSCPAGCGGAIQITGSAQPLLQNLIISNSTAQQLGGGLYAESGSPLTLVGVTIISNTSAHNSGGGLFAGDVLTLTNVSLLRNRAPNGAGGVRAASIVFMTGGIFQDNHAFNPGGAIRVSGPFTANGGLFSNNSAGIVIPNGSGINGGGLRADADALLLNVSFISNAVNNNGGGAFVVGQLNAFSMNVISNTAAHDGGGLYAVITGSLGGTFSGNLALSGRGGEFFGGGSADFDGAELTANQAATDGGGAFVVANARSSGANFTLNSAGGSGGGLFAGGDVQFNGSDYVTNTTALGGGAFVSGSAVLAGPTFQGNQAQNDAGGIFVALTATVLGPTFVGNKALNGIGGGLLVSGTLTGNGPTAQQNEARNGGGAYVSGTVDISFPQFVLNVAHNSLGGGLHTASPITITAGLFAGNVAADDGALDAQGGGAVVVNSLFVNNTATATQQTVAGAMLMSTNGPTTLLHNTLVDTSGHSQIAIINHGGQISVADNIVVGYGVAISGSFFFEDYNLFFDNLILTVTGHSLGHSLVANPQFVDPAGGNYHLSTASPARDAGVNAGLTTDFDGDPRPIGAGLDIGFDEFVFLNRLFLPLIMR